MNLKILPTNTLSSFLSVELNRSKSKPSSTSGVSSVGSMVSSEISKEVFIQILYVFIATLYSAVTTQKRDEMSEGKEFENFVQIVKKLRDPDTGCPWDLKQTHQTLIRFMIEECYEAVEAIKSENKEDLKDELGDVLLQVVLHSQLAVEKSHFSIKDVIQNISEKMISRHPHVFSDVTANTEEEVKRIGIKLKMRKTLTHLKK